MSDSKTIEKGEDVFPITVDAESVEMRIVERSGELEITINRPDGEPLHQYVELPDVMYDQLFEKGVVEHEE